MALIPTYISIRPHWFNIPYVHQACLRKKRTRIVTIHELIRQATYDHTYEWKIIRIPNRLVNLSKSKYFLKWLDVYWASSWDLASLTFQIYAYTTKALPRASAHPHYRFNTTPTLEIREFGESMLWIKYSLPIWLQLDQH